MKKNILSSRKFLYKNNVLCLKKYFIIKFIMAGISNQNTLNFIEEKTNNDIKKKFVGVFPLNFITKFIMFHRMMNEKGAQYPVIIMNTDRSNKKSTHWWSFLNLHPKKKIFYLTALVLMISKNFYYKLITRVLIKFFMELKNPKKRQQNNSNNFNLFYGRV